MPNKFERQYVPDAYVLRDNDANDAARALIEGGRQKDPFYIFNMDEAYSRMQHFKEMMPRVKIFYAMKSNDSEMMLKLAIALGIGFDCASPGEIYKIRQLNVNPLNIIYAMPHKTPEQIIFARESGVKHTTFDTSSELKKIKQYWPDARLLIRVKVESESKYALGDKFGCNTEAEAIDLLEEAASLGLCVVGVAFHVGSVCSSADSHMVGLRKARALFDHEARAGREMKIVDIGGGFRSDNINRIDQVANLVNATLEELFPDPSVQVIAEPGRYICDSAFLLYCNIINTRRIIKDNKPINMIYLNDGIYGSLRYPEPWQIVTRFQWSSEKDDKVVEDTILWGPSCDSTDQVMKEYDIKLPQCTHKDWIIFTLQGAYSFGFCTKFSSLESPLIRSVISSELWNKIKGSPVFGPSEFVVNPDFSNPLPSSLPAPPTSKIYEEYGIPSLQL